MLLLALPIASLLAAPPVVQEVAPANLAVDGALGEWAPYNPSVTMGPADQVAGPSKAGASGDFAAKIWIAVTADGIVIAGEVADDKVKLPEAGKIVNADHAELWVSLPGASFPKLGYANQFGEIEIPNEAACDTAEEIEEPDECKAWVKRQITHRAKLEKIFVRQFMFTPTGVVEGYATPKLGKDKESGCCQKSQSAVKAFEGGWRFEARIALEDFPATSQLALADLALQVDAVDADDGIDKLETFLSTNPQRKYGSTAGFHAVKLRKPIEFESDPPILAGIAKATPNFFFQPGRPVVDGYAFANVPVGYQYQPSSNSPAVVPHPVDAVVPVASLGDVKVYRAPAPEGGSALWSYKSKKNVARFAIGGDVKATTQRGDVQHVLIYESGTVHAMGTGACGTCPLHTIQVVALDATGNFKEVFHADLAEETIFTDASGAEISVEEVTFEGAKDLSAFTLKGRKLKDGADAGEYVRSWKWDRGFRGGSYKEAK